MTSLILRSVFIVFYFKTVLMLKMLNIYMHIYTQASLEAVSTVEIDYEYRLN